MRLLSMLILLVGLVACGDDDATPDTGLADVGTDTGEPETDAGEDDAGDEDSGEPEMDAGESDAGESDAGEDAAEPDAGEPDAAEPDAGEPDAGRTVFEGPCARRLGTCTEDSDCMASGCGGETCASEEIISTCDCTMPAATCGCVDGMCNWYN